MSIVLKKKELDLIMPLGAQTGRTDLYFSAINETFERFKVETYARANDFLAQVAHESGEMRFTEEDLYYLSAESIKTIYPYFFKKLEDAEPYVKNSAKLANYVYANRGGNGPEESGDGYKFRGHGGIQCTFKNNHYACADYFGVPREEIVEWLKKSPGYILCAGWYFEINNLWRLSDSDTDEDFVLQTKAINGGTNGIEDRRMYRARGRKVFEES